MNKQILSGILLLFTVLSGQAQTITAVYKPGQGKGDDVMLHSYYPAGNFADGPELFYISWTSGSAFTCRSLIRFTEADTIPVAAMIISAELKLFGVASSTSYGNNYHPGSPYPQTNEGYLQRVTSPWDKLTVTWASKPGSTTVNQAAIPASTTRWDWNYSIDVTKLFKDIRSTGSNYGFMLMLQTEARYRSVIFASSDHADANRHPELIVKYSLPTSLEEHSSKAGAINVYPNPASDFINIQGMDAGSVIRLYDAAGKNVAEKVCQSTTETLDIQHIAKGVYQLNIINVKGENMNKRIVK